MTLSDEKLSAFLDAELPEHEMALIREQIANDEHMADRLERLAQVDQALQDHYTSIDERPLPKGLIERIQASAPQAEQSTHSNSATVLPFPTRIGQWVQHNSALAASITLMIGLFGGYQLAPINSTPSTVSTQDRLVSHYLDALPSGESATLGTADKLTPMISFKNTEGDMCRHYVISGNASQASENIACKVNGAWQTTAIIMRPSVPQSEYGTATRSPIIESILDKMISGDIIDPSQENTLIENGWKKLNDDTN